MECTRLGAIKSWSDGGRPILSKHTRTDMHGKDRMTEEPSGG